jgi:hypothetical protein
MKFTIDPWDPTYGASVESELGQSAIEAEIAIEVAAELWAPRDPPAGIAIPDAVVFVDGVRRVEARAWIEQDDTAVPGIFASYAAGAAEPVCARRTLTPAPSPPR